MTSGAAVPLTGGGKSGITGAGAVAAASPAVAGVKEAPLEEVEAVALQLKPLCKEHEAILVLDDHVELARKLEVDGVHLGKKDMPIDQARQILGVYRIQLRVRN